MRRDPHLALRRDSSFSSSWLLVFSAVCSICSVKSVTFGVATALGIWVAREFCVRRMEHLVHRDLSCPLTSAPPVSSSFLHVLYSEVLTGFAVSALKWIIQTKTKAKNTTMHPPPQKKKKPQVPPSQPVPRPLHNLEPRIVRIHYFRRHLCTFHEFPFPGIKVLQLCFSRSFACVSVKPWSQWGIVVYIYL